MNPNTQYWLMAGAQRLGPMSFQEAVKQITDPTTPVWHDGLTDWTPAGELPEFASLFRINVEQPFGAGYGQPYSAGQPYGQQPYQQPYRQPVADDEAMPSTYLAWSIVTMLLCCLPTGIVALVYSTKVSARWRMGDRAGARKASDRAALWIAITVVAGLIWAPFQAVFSLFTV